jgi:hypothetical protein
MNDKYFELVRSWIKRARDEETAEFGHHPCAPHEEHQHEDCPELCKCGHTCRDHVHLDGKNMRWAGPKPTAYICLGSECPCRMFEDKGPA